jgi:hypothetical protein
VQVTGDRRQRRRHDRLVQRGQQHPQQQRADDDEPAALPDLFRLGLLGGWRGHRAVVHATTSRLRSSRERAVSPHATELQRARPDA